MNTDEGKYIIVSDVLMHKLTPIYAIKAENMEPMGTHAMDENISDETVSDVEIMELEVIDVDTIESEVTDSKLNDSIEPEVAKIQATEKKLTNRKVIETEVINSVPNNVSGVDVAEDVKHGIASMMRLFSNGSPQSLAELAEQASVKLTAPLSLRPISPLPVALVSSRGTPPSATPPTMPHATPPVTPPATPPVTPCISVDGDSFHDDDEENIILEAEVSRLQNLQKQYVAPDVYMPEGEAGVCEAGVAADDFVPELERLESFEMRALDEFREFAKSMESLTDHFDGAPLTIFPADPISGGDSESIPIVDIEPTLDADRVSVADYSDYEEIAVDEASDNDAFLEIDEPFVSASGMVDETAPPIPVTSDPDSLALFKLSTSENGENPESNHVHETSPVTPDANVNVHANQTPIAPLDSHMTSRVRCSSPTQIETPRANHAHSSSPIPYDTHLANQTHRSSDTLLDTNQDNHAHRASPSLSDAFKSKVALYMNSTNKYYSERLRDTVNEELETRCSRSSG